MRLQNNKYSKNIRSFFIVVYDLMVFPFLYYPLYKRLYYDFSLHKFLLKIVLLYVLMSSSACVVTCVDGNKNSRFNLYYDTGHLPYLVNKY